MDDVRKHLLRPAPKGCGPNRDKQGILKMFTQFRRMTETLVDHALNSRGQRDPQLAGWLLHGFLRALGTEGWLGWSRSWAMLPLRTRCPASRGSLLGAGTGGSDAPHLRSPTARRLLAGDGNGTLIAATSYA